MIEQRKDA